ncbi:hypothetical protein [Fluviicola sp.]|uniref:hypothetical protein n=1 Tax=Fluviicola sp. TaxID=1917219 RepID=UPI0031E0805F
MKPIFTFVTLVLAFTTFGQDTTHLGKSFVMSQNYKARECNAVGEPIPGDTNSCILLMGFLLRVEAITGSNYVIHIAEFSHSKELNEKFVRKTALYPTGEENKHGKNANSSNLPEPTEHELKVYFLIPINQFNFLTDPQIPVQSRHTFTAGIPTIPAKLRFGNGGTGNDPRYFRFEGNISLGLSAGWKYSFGKGSTKYAMNLLTGFTVASVPVDSITTRGKVNSSTTCASFSPHFGLVFDVDKVQFGLYTGLDFLYGEPNKYWVYRNQPWLGIGIGYSLFQVGGQSANTKNTKPD